MYPYEVVFKYQHGDYKTGKFFGQIYELSTKGMAAYKCEEDATTCAERSMDAFNKLAKEKNTGLWCIGYEVKKVEN